VYEKKEGGGGGVFFFFFFFLKVSLSFVLFFGSLC